MPFLLLLDRGASGSDGDDTGRVDGHCAMLPSQSPRYLVNSRGPAAPPGPRPHRERDEPNERLGKPGGGRGASGRTGATDAPGRDAGARLTEPDLGSDTHSRSTPVSPTGTAELDAALHSGCGAFRNR